MRKLKRSVLKEEMLVLTGDFKLAMVLNQMIYWSQYMNDFEHFIEEERKRNQDIKIEPLNGWIFKKAEELVDETMINVSGNAMRRYLKTLVKAGWLDERDNPKYKWDHTKQYRVNLVKIQADLFEHGYYLAGYKVDLTSLQKKGSNQQKMDPGTKTSVSGTKAMSSGEQSLGTIPEITSEITLEITTENIPFVAIVNYLNEKTSKNYRAETRKTRELIKARWNENHRLEEFKKVIDNKTTEWLDNPTMNKFLRPATLFGNNFEAYLNQKEVNSETEFERYLKELK